MGGNLFVLKMCVNAEYMMISYADIYIGKNTTLA